MKNLMKLFAIVAVVTLLLAAAITCALADEKIYTSPAFKLPKDKIQQWVEDLPEEETPEEETLPEGDETSAEPAEDGEPAEQPAEGEAVPEEGDVPAEGQEAEPDEPAEPERSVSIFSSQGSMVTEGEIIYLTSVLEGFDGLDVTYQWQVDRDDGNGWVDVEGANRDKHMFVASKETIRYSWRLIVNVDE